MKALITGASSGIGYEITKYLDKLGYETIIVARSESKLVELKNSLKNKCSIITTDLSKEENLYSLYDSVKNEDIDLLVNNAGFGLCGYFNDLDINKEIEMINLNIKSVHILTKLFLNDMIKKDNGYILNVASSAAFESGPLMATYYASKSYVYRLSESIYYELKKLNSNVHISCLCPGPVDTNFNNVAGVSFSVKPLNASDVAKYAVNNTLKGRMLIIPGFGMKMSKFFGRFVSDKLMMKFVYNIQKSKIENGKKD